MDIHMDISNVIIEVYNYSRKLAVNTKSPNIHKDRFSDVDLMLNHFLQNLIRQRVRLRTFSHNTFTCNIEREVKIALTRRSMTSTFTMV